MRRHYLAFALCFVAVLFYQCQKELSYVGGPDTTPNVVTPDPVTSNVNGNVFDENGAPAVGVTVRVGAKTATTDAKGYFRINAASLDKKTALVTAEKAGYFKAFRTFAATSGTNQVVIKLIPKQITGTVNGAAGGEVGLSNGTKVSFPANGIVNASTNAAYTGTVNVYMSYIDPSAADIADRVPGSFMANDKNGNRVVLASYGMVAVELESSTGDKLQIKSGTTATLTTAIPTVAQSNAPATIPLWSIDETTGLWKEEGTATKSGNVYIGQVSHFSFWNCDAPFPVTYVSMTLKNSAGLPIVHARIRVTMPNAQGWGVTGYGFTDTLGQVCGLMPMNTPLTLEVLDQCGNPFYSQSIGPFSGPTNIGNITITNTGASVVTISGKLVNCANAAITDGYAIISTGNWVRYAATDANGNFQTTMMHCASSPLTYTIIGVDKTTQQQGTATGTITIPNTAAGNVSACGVSTTQFINYTIDGTSYTLGGVPGDSLMGYTFNQGALLTSIQGMRLGTTNRFSIYFQHSTMSPGSYPVYAISAGTVNSGGQGPGPNAVITVFPTSVGQFYEGSIAGNFVDSLFATHTINATFRVRRLQ